MCYKDLSQDCKLVISCGQMLLSDINQYLNCCTTKYLVLFKMKLEYEGHKTLLIWKIYFRILFISDHWLSIYSTKTSLLINKSIAW